MTAGPRAYGVAVERKLYRVARGTCYFPDCKRAIMFDVGEQPVCDVEIAHIRGAEKNSARYDEKMTDEQRAAFANLILLCSGHHKLVDRDEISYPVDVLERWKGHNEDDDLAVLAVGLNEETLTAALEEIAGKLRPHREVSVELECGVILPAGTGAVMTAPDLATLERTIRNNPGWNHFPRVLVTNIRSTGSAAIEIEGVDLYFLLIGRDGTSPGEGRVMGQDTFPGLNPSLPHRLEDGSALTWFTKFEAVESMVDAGESHDQTVPSIRSEVRLSTGERASSSPFDLTTGGPTSP